MNANVTDWEAAIAAYVALALVAETEWAPLAVVLAWGIAIEQVLEAASGKSFISNLLGSVPWPGVSKSGGPTNAGP